MKDIGVIFIRKDADQVFLTIETRLPVRSKFDELEGKGNSLKEALEDLLEQVEVISL